MEELNSKNIITTEPNKNDNTLIIVQSSMCADDVVFISKGGRTFVIYKNYKK